MYVCTGPCARKHACKRRSEDDVRYSLEPSTLFFETGSLSLKLSSRRGCLANKPHGSSWLSARITCLYCHSCSLPHPLRPNMGSGTELRSSCLDGKYSTVSHLSSPGLEPLILLLSGFLTHFFTHRETPCQLPKASGGPLCTRLPGAGLLRKQSLSAGAPSLALGRSSSLSFWSAREDKGPAEPSLAETAPRTSVGMSC